MTFAPQNDLERSLLKASIDPAHRPQFYRDFLASDIFAIQYGVQLPEKDRQSILDEGRTLQLAMMEYEGKPHIPIFSSLERLKAVLTEDAAYLGINALEFLKITRGAPLLLNPGSDYGKEFSESEVASILDGSIWRPVERYVVEKPTQVTISQPNVHPTELTAALCRLFPTMAEVKRAWLAQYLDPEQDEKPHTLIAIEHTGDWEQVAGQAGMVIKDVEIPDPPVSLMQITEKEAGAGGVADYFLEEVKPFYERNRPGH